MSRSLSTLLLSPALLLFAGYRKNSEPLFFTYDK